MRALIVEGGARCAFIRYQRKIEKLATRGRRTANCKEAKGQARRKGRKVRRSALHSRPSLGQLCYSWYFGSGAATSYRREAHVLLAELINPHVPVEQAPGKAVPAGLAGAQEEATPSPLTATRDETPFLPCWCRETNAYIPAPPFGSGEVQAERWDKWRQRSSSRWPRSLFR